MGEICQLFSTTSHQSRKKRESCRLSAADTVTALANLVMLSFG